MKCCAALSGARATEGTPRREMHERYLRELTGLDADACTAALDFLREHNYVIIFSEYASDANRRNNWYTLSELGMQIYQESVEKLQAAAAM